MIRVTRLNGKQYVVNSELIKFVEETPDTIITLTTNEKLMIKESVDYVVNASIDFKQRLLHEPPQKVAKAEG